MDHWSNHRGNTKYLQTNENKKHNDPKPMGHTKVVLWGKFIVIQAYIRKQEKSQVNNLSLHLKQLEKEQTKPNITRRKEIIKIRAVINEIDTKKTIEKINETKIWFFEKINKIEKPLAILIKKTMEGAQIYKIRNQKWVTMNTTEIKRIIRDYYKKLYATKMDNLEEMGKFLEKCNLPWQKQEKKEI